MRLVPSRPHVRYRYPLRCARPVAGAGALPAPADTHPTTTISTCTCTQPGPYPTPPSLSTPAQSRLLGRYLHVLMPADKKFNKFIASAESAEGEWKGRMRAFSEVSWRRSWGAWGGVNRRAAEGKGWRTGDRAAFSAFSEVGGELGRVRVKRELGRVGRGSIAKRRRRSGERGPGRLSI